jgi:hypothetical protein
LAAVLKWGIRRMIAIGAASRPVPLQAADCGQPGLAKEAAGLLAISKGLSLNFADDHEMLGHGMVIYDALYAWCADTPLQKAARFLGLK